MNHQLNSYKSKKYADTPAPILFNFNEALQIFTLLVNPFVVRYRHTNFSSRINNASWQKHRLCASKENWVGKNQQMSIRSAHYRSEVLNVKI